MGGDNNPFPHDGKQGRCGCGQGYSWNDDTDFHGRHNYSGGGGGDGCGKTAILLIAVVICSIIGAFNKRLKASGLKIYLNNRVKANELLIKSI